jgi:hypothetical protein
MGSRSTSARSYRRSAAEGMPLDEAPGRSGPSGTGNNGRRSLFRRVLRAIGWISAGPAGWAGLSELWRGAALIRVLSLGLGSRSGHDPGFRTTNDRSFDFEATAFLHGVSVSELQQWLALRQRQTAGIAYVMFALGLLFLTAWVWEALLSPSTVGRMVFAAEFLPFCALSFLVAFHNALLNFQIRTGRMASWREYLATSEPFWPR